MADADSLICEYREVPIVPSLPCRNGKAQVVHATDAPREILLKAARSCPYRAITAVDEENGEQLFPPVRNPANQPD